MPSAIRLLTEALAMGHGPDEQQIKDILDNHDAEARELQELRDAVPALEKRIAALEARNADDDQLANEALAGFTGETEPTPPVDQSGADTTTEAEGQPPADDQTGDVATGKGSK